MSDNEPKSNTDGRSDELTSEEIANLRRHDQEASAYFKMLLEWDKTIRECKSSPGSKTDEIEPK